MKKKIRTKDDAGLSLHELSVKYSDIPNINKTSILAKFLYSELHAYCKENNTDTDRLETEHNYDGYGLRPMKHAATYYHPNSKLNIAKLTSLVKLLYDETLEDFTKRENIKYELAPDINQSRHAESYTAIMVTELPNQKNEKPEKKPLKVIIPENGSVNKAQEPIDKKKSKEHKKPERESVRFHDGKISLNIDEKNIQPRSNLYFINVDIKIGETTETIPVFETPHYDKALQKFCSLKKFINEKTENKEDMNYYEDKLTQWKLEEITNLKESEKKSRTI